MTKTTTVIIWLGLDVHKAIIAACWFVDSSEVPHIESIPNTPKALRSLISRLGKEGEVRACYEAGPCGYEVKRQLDGMGVRCDVIAPSLIPRKPGEHFKTDRRDARKLASLFRAGLLTSILVPTKEQEAIRDLVRCREDVVVDGMRVWHRMIKFLLRHGRAWHQTQGGSKAHWAWLRAQKFEDPHQQRTYDEYLAQVDFQRARRAALDAEIEAIAQQAPWKDQVDRLRCLRGIGVLSALTLLVEILDFRRFGPRELAAFVGLVPGIHSSAGKATGRPGITRAGNVHVRRIVVEAAWQNSHAPQLPSVVRKRCPGQPEAVVSIASRAQERLHRRYRRLRTTGKMPAVAITAVARELLGFIWSLMTLEERAQPERTRRIQITGRQYGQARTTRPTQGGERTTKKLRAA